ncbi:MAG: hypothetical protein JWP12_3673 [Bacteroidetes bacterium]|nr:hypothetical protein [Bacteroidota bacterium]
MKHFRIFFLFFLISAAAYAGDTDTNYVQRFKNIFAAKVFLNQNNFTYAITPQHNSAFTKQQLKDAEVIFNPYIPPTMGVSLNIYGIGASYTFKLKNDFLDTMGRATSAFKQFQMNIYGTKFGFEAYYQDYQRFYYHYKGDEELVKNYNSDIRAYQFGANAIMIFNGQKFSYNAAFNQTVLQKKSAGSMLLMMSLKFNELKADNLIPDSVKNYFGSYTELQRNRNYSYQMQLGYSFDLTKKSFYFSGLVAAGAGIQNQTYSFPMGKFYKIAFPLVGRGKASAGYNGKFLFTGIYANVDVSQSSIRAIKTQQMIYSYGVFLGFRAVKYTKSKGQLKADAKRQKEAEKAAAKKKKVKKK